MTALVIDNAVKIRGDLVTVDDVSLKVEPGQRLALLGHNGAGKTTLIGMVLGLTSLTSGTITVLGSAPGARRARRCTGFLPENVAFHGALTGAELLRHFAALKSVSRASADDLLERVGLAEAADRRVATYSKGMVQRVGLAQAMLGAPKLVLLDEPTSGLDPISRHDFYDIVEELARSGAAVLLSSHALTELETRTDRIAIMSQGRLVANDTLAGLRRGAGLPIVFEVTTKAETADKVAAKLGGMCMNGRLVRLTCQPEGKIELLGRITSLGGVIRDVDVSSASLEDLYRHYSEETEGVR